jgi:hypothetical protein
MMSNSFGVDRAERDDIPSGGHSRPGQLGLESKGGKKAKG